MLKVTMAALSVAAVVAGGACAAPMLLTINGDFNDDAVWYRWQVHIRYDSDLGVVTFDPSDEYGRPRATLAWDQSMGTPSPVSAVYGGVIPLEHPEPPNVRPRPHRFRFTDPTTVKLERGLTFDFFSVAGPDWYVNLGDIARVNREHPTDYRFDTEWSRYVEEYGSWRIGIRGSSPHVHGYITAERVGAIPEPGAWALIILGFAAAGAALRKRRAREASPDLIRTDRPAVACPAA